MGNRANIPEVFRGEMLVRGEVLTDLKQRLKGGSPIMTIETKHVRLLVESIELQAKVIRDLNNKISRLEDRIIELEDQGDPPEDY